MIKKKINIHQKSVHIRASHGVFVIFLVDEDVFLVRIDVANTLFLISMILTSSIFKDLEASKLSFFLMPSKSFLGDRNKK